MDWVRKSKKIISLWLPVIGWCSLLFYFSSIPNLRAVESSFWDEIIRSSAHLVFYAILYGLFFRALNLSRPKKNFWLPFILAALYGLSDEIHQIFVPTRTFQLRDLIIDCSGVSFGGLILWKLLPKMPAPLKAWAGKLGLV